MFSRKTKSETDRAFPDYAGFLPAGLGNPGNLCYFNSLIQTFASSAHWVEFLKSHSHIDPVIAELSSIITNINQSFASGKSLSTKKCRSQLVRIGKAISITQQQDFHEFYMELLKNLMSCFSQTATMSFAAFSTRRVFPTDFIYKETIQCQQCRWSTSSINQTSSVILDVGTGSLVVALQQFFGPIPIRSRCSHCGKTSDRVQTRKIVFVPKSILFFINRRQFAESTLPSTREFSFPFTLDLTEYSMSPYIEEPKQHDFMRMSLSGLSESVQQPSHGMKLTSVVGFKGSDNAGHYYNCRIHREPQPPFTNRWVCANDNRVSAVSLEDVMSMKSVALLLNYEYDV